MTIEKKRAEVIVGWLNRLRSHYSGNQQQSRVTGDNFNAMANEVQLFVLSLDDYSPTVIDQAFNMHLLSSRWMPKVSEIKSLADTVQESSDGSGNGSNEHRAWQSFCTALKHESPAKGMPRFYDAKIPQVINDLGGWKHLAQCNEVELQTFVRKEFLQRYKAITVDHKNLTLIAKSAKSSGMLANNNPQLSLQSHTS